MQSEYFVMNNFIWKIVFVDADDPMLVDRTNTLTVATTDIKNLVVYLSNELYGNFLLKVFIHELGHCALYSFGLLDWIHTMTKREYWIDIEEFICNFLADYGMSVFRIAYKKFGYNSWKLIPGQFENILKG